MKDINKQLKMYRKLIMEMKSNKDSSIDDLTMLTPGQSLNKPKSTPSPGPRHNQSIVSSWLKHIVYTFEFIKEFYLISFKYLKYGLCWLEIIYYIQDNIALYRAILYINQKYLYQIQDILNYFLGLDQTN